MVKRTLAGTVARRSATQVAEDIIRQLCDNTVTDWLSNGEDAVHGRLQGIRVNAKGLRLTLDSGRTVVWKVGAGVSHAVMLVMGQRFGWQWVKTGELAAV